MRVFPRLQNSEFQRPRVPKFEGSFQGFQGFRVSGLNGVPGFQNSKVPGSEAPAFQGSRRSALTQVEIPNSITMMGRSALELKKL